MKAIQCGLAAEDIADRKTATMLSSLLLRFG